MTNSRPLYPEYPQTLPHLFGTCPSSSSINSTFSAFYTLCILQSSKFQKSFLTPLQLYWGTGWPQDKVGLHTWTLRWIQVSGLSFVGSGRCIRMFLLFSLVVSRGPVMYTGQEYTSRPAETGASLAPRACMLTLTGGRGLGWLEKLSCKAPSIWSHSAYWSCNPVSSNPILGTLGFGPFSTWGRQKTGKAMKVRVNRVDKIGCNQIL